jgi:hypothetical protein
MTAAKSGIKWFDACPYSVAFLAERLHFDAVFYLNGGKN